MPVRNPFVPRLNPSGRLGVIVYVRVPFPSAPTTGCTAVRAVLIVPVTTLTTTVAVSGGCGATYISKCWLLVFAALSVTVTVKVPVANITVGLPLTCPFEVLKFIPFILVAILGAIANV